jgi:hypothetical protein
MGRLSTTPVVGRRLQETKVEILPTASRRVTGCVMMAPMALRATQTARRNRRCGSPHRHCLLHLMLLWAGTAVETAGRNLFQESAERPHLRAFRDLRNTSAQTPNSHLQTATHTCTLELLSQGLVVVLSSLRYVRHVIAAT